MTSRSGFVESVKVWQLLDFGGQHGGFRDVLFASRARAVRQFEEGRSTRFGSLRADHFAVTDQLAGEASGATAF